MSETSGRSAEKVSWNAAARGIKERFPRVRVTAGIS